jgi:hypothetical protein
VVVAMSSLVEQAPALLGVLIGALAAYAATALAERARWRRERLSRHQERQLQAYGDYALAVKRQLSAILRLAAARGLPGAVDGVGVLPQEGQRLVAEAEELRTAAWESVLLVGSDAAVVAGRSWHGAVGWMYRVALGPDSGQEWHQAVEAVGAARREFYAVVRIDVGNEPSADPAIFEWQVAKMLRGTSKA